MFMMNPVQLGGQFKPTDINGCVLWLRGDRGLYQDTAFTTPSVNENDPIGGWQDQSGQTNHATQATAAARPLLKLGIVNGQPVLRFDGSAANLSITSLSLPGGSVSLFVVSKVASKTAYGTFINYDDSNSNTSFVFRQQNMTGFLQFTNHIADAGAIGSTDLSVDGFDILGGLLISSQYTVYKNGTQEATNVYGTNLMTSAIARLGSGNAGTVQFLNGDVAEVVIYSPAISTTDRHRVERYLGQRYAITVSS